MRELAADLRAEHRALKITLVGLLLNKPVLLWTEQTPVRN
jgi:hypothetical protein